MKTKFLFFAALVLSGMLFSSCEDDTIDLLKDLGERKMVYIINDGEPATFNICEFTNYGQDFKGLVYISGMDGMTTESNSISFYLGEEGSNFQLQTRTYSTAIANDKFVVLSTFGSSDIGKNVTLVITEITENEIKGTFNGKIGLDDAEPVKIRGAFRASREIFH